MTEWFLVGGIQSNLRSSGEASRVVVFTQSNTNRKTLLARVTRQSDPPERDPRPPHYGLRRRDPPAPAGPPPWSVVHVSV